MDHPRRGCSKLLSCEVIRSPQDSGGPRQRILVGRGLLSSWPLLLSGDAWRTPAIGGRDTLGCDCFFFDLVRVFFTKLQALSSNNRFIRASFCLGLYVICTCHVLMN
jgi:hypothetical protein